jgi:hypothetical protein
MGGCDGVGHASRSSGLLCVEASQTRVSQSVLKTGGDAAAGGARGRHDGRSRCCVESKLKMDGSMRQAASDPSIPPLPFSMY